MTICVNQLEQSMATVNEIMRTLRSEAGRDNPYPLYAQLHERGAACTIEPDSGERYQVVVHGYDAVNQILRSPSYKVVDGDLLERAGRNWREHPSLSALLTSMFFTNGPSHTRMRGAFTRAFTPRRLAEVREPIARITEGLIDAMADKGAGGAVIDFMKEFGFVLPGDVICEVMGVPRADRAWFMDRAHIFADLVDLGTATDEVYRRADEATVELTEYFGDLAAHRRENPGDDMISVVAQRDTDVWVDDTELIATLLTLFNAGYASTAHLLGKSLPILAGHPDWVAEMSSSDAMASRYVDEVLRLEPPTHFVVRFSPEEQEIAGVRVPANSLVLALVGAANYDPSQFDRPEEFNPHRPNLHPLSFGAGIHFCLGAPLTRLEGVVALPMLFQRFPKLSVVEGAVMTHRLALHGYNHLSVTLN